MKRQTNGVNFDEGLALQTQEELSLLYVETRSEEIGRLVEWYNNEEREALLLGGQIGVGKSTLLSALTVLMECKPDILFAFDRETPAFSPGGFWGYAFGRLVECALRNDLPIPNELAPSDFLEVRTDDWSSFASLLTSFPKTMAENDRLSTVHSHISARAELVKRQCMAILKALEEKSGQPLRIFCEGVDKFALGTPDLQSLAPVLDMLAGSKTVFEVNAVHLFADEWKWQRVPRLNISTFEEPAIVNLLLKRLGVYEAGRRDVLPAVARFSGGNPRQALRLLMTYDYARGVKRMSKEDAFGYACRRVRIDYLYLSFAALPQDILTAVNRDGFVRSGLIRGVGLMTPAAEAVYKNWLILGTKPEDEDKWPARLNPLLQTDKFVTEGLPDSPEMTAIRKWAERHGVSPYGLDFDASHKSSVEVLSEISSSSSSMDVLNIVELLDTLAAALFSTDRCDRVLIAYREASVMEVARDYLVGKASEMGFSPVVNIALGAMQEGDRPAGLFAALTETEGNAIYSILLPRSPDKPFLRQLDRRRDVFVPYEMLWWVHKEDLHLCLQEWPQLRQLMSVYILEDELLGSLTPEELQADLNYLALLEKDEPLHEAERRFQQVLNVVRETRE